jgi:Flp pilus assembly protein TadB
MYSMIATESTQARRDAAHPPSARGSIVATLLVVCIPVALWFVSTPIAGAVAAGAVGGFVATAAVRRAARLRRTAREASPPRPARASACRARQ